MGGEFVGIPTPVTTRTLSCPFCRRDCVGGIKILPLSFSDLERAVQVRKQSAKESANQNINGKRSIEEVDEESAFRQVEAESSFLLLSHTTVGGASDRHKHRTGRWTPEEVQYVDYIVSAFESGTLAIPHGVKLNDLLGELLLCKSSRLTKKMKNAKLSTRSYTLKSPIRALDSHCCATLSNLQERFLASVPSEPSQLELRFNMTKLWRTHFSNLCLQVGYELLDARDWVASLEQMEGKASEAEDHIRRARRRRMSIALRTDVGEAANAGVFIGGMPARDANMQPPPVPSAAGVTATASSLPESFASATKMKREVSEVTVSDLDKQDNSNVDDDDEFLAALEMTAQGEGPTRSRLASEDMDFGFIDDMVDPLSMMPHLDDNPSSPGDCGPFLEEIGSYMETHNVPFQYADVWVPSFMGDNGQATSMNSDQSKLRLFPAGHATRSDMDATVRSQLNEFGSYTAHFSFEPGHGLPGRVYTNGVASWETRIHEADPSVFERAGGASVYGIKTAVGIPLTAEGIGRIVVALYSTSDIEKDEAMLEKFIQDFKMWNPEPKWKLVIDLGSSSKANRQVMASAVPTQMVHYTHQKQDQGGLKPPPVESKSAPVRRTSSVVSAASVTLPAAAMPPATTTKMMCHQHASTKSDAASAGPVSGSMDDDLEQKIACLFGDHMPSQESSAAALLPHFMSLRLMLLRVRERRSAEENEKLDILKRSFEGYSKDNRRSGSDLACLLAKDWMFLQPNFGMAESPQSNPSPQPHQSHAMQANGAPMTQPNLMPVPLPTYSLPPAAAAQPTSMRMIVHKHVVRASTCAPTSRSRSVSTTSEASAAQLADIVPES